MTALLKIGLVSVSDRASQGIYPDQGIPELRNWLQQALADSFEVVERLIHGPGKTRRDPGCHPRRRRPRNARFR